MPYKNITFIKIKMELLEDDRFLFDLNDKQKGIFVLLLALAGKTNNLIRNNEDFIKTRLGLKELDMKDIQRISQVFPKFFLQSEYWRFKNFNKSHNFIFTKELPRNSQGTPKDFQRKHKSRVEKSRVRVEKKRGRVEEGIPTDTTEDTKATFFKLMANGEEQPSEKEVKTLEDLERLSRGLSKANVFSLYQLAGSSLACTGWEKATLFVLENVFSKIKKSKVKLNGNPYDYYKRSIKNYIAEKGDEISAEVKNG